MSHKVVLLFDQTSKFASRSILKQNKDGELQMFFHRGYRL